ncbi:hypothetical protein [Piscinibacter defluvii]|uniref:hypothetical protein n=2 Tax=Piscinibacter TaxID=1114981 RepID=UPI000FDDD7D0|nr:hypothetical protein [Piscinibacter defluvii]
MSQDVSVRGRGVAARLAVPPDNRPMPIRTLTSLLAIGLAATACSPSRDWRELHPEGSSLRAQFPCKPDRHQREVRLAGRTVRMDMLVCHDRGATFALAFADVADPGAVAPALDELRAAAVGNVKAAAVHETALAVPGMTPNPRAVRLQFDGKRPDGTPVQEQVGLFAYGMRVYQATVLASRLKPAEADTFLGALRVSP